MKNLISINGAKALTKTEQKQVIGGGGGRPIGDFEDCYENDPGVGDLCFSDFDCAHNQICTIERTCACGTGQGGGGCAYNPILCP